MRFEFAADGEFGRGRAALRVLLIGPPGSGKGTQAKHLSRRLDLPHISTGEMLRAHDPGSEAERQLRRRIDQGQFAPDELMLRWIAERLERADCSPGYLLDGFPRTMVQAEAFDRQLASLGHQLDHVLHLDVDLPTLTARLLARHRTECRSDDVRRTISCRFDLYRHRTEPLLEYYCDRKLVRQVAGDGTPDQVFQRILAGMGVQA